MNEATLPSAPKTKTAQEMRESAAEWVPLATLHEWRANPDKPTAKDVRDVARSIKRFGFTEPIIARKANGEICAGHSRFLAAKRLKMERVPVRFMDLSEDEAHAYALADNKLASNRERDWRGDEVSAVMRELADKGVELEIGTGFSDDELGAILREDDQSDLIEQNAPDTRVKSKFIVQVTCKDERGQAKLLERLQAEGYKVRAFLS